MNIPGIPAGNSNINMKISTNVDANALSVLQNSADVFDWADTIPGSLLPQIQSQASEPVLEEGHELDLLLLPEHADEAVLAASSPGRRSSPASTRTR